MLRSTQPAFPHLLDGNTITRRQLFQTVGGGMGTPALAALLANDTARAADTRGVPHKQRRAKSVIFLHMVGAPSQLDLFDEKPKLRELDGKLLPADLWKGLRLAFIRKRPSLMASPFRFRRHGQCGTALSELLPHLSRVVDELAIIKSLHTDQFNHAPAQLMMHTGAGQFGRPSLGSWTSYGLGSENQDLPSFVVLITGQVAGAGNSLWGSAFLPSVHQGVEFRTQGDPVLYLSNPSGITRQDRGAIVDGIRQLNRIRLADVADPEIATRIDQYELAYRMQIAVPELMDITSETSETLQLYGAELGKESFANNCLLARRLVERGVRFVQLYDSGWDHHSGIHKSLPRKCQQIDRPAAALILDLKRRGLLDDTLVVWASEFGRTPMLQAATNAGASNNMGRDHHRYAFTSWMAGGGVRPGITYGQTDEIGFGIVDRPLHINDLHATILHLLGVDHQQLTFRFQGREFRLTDVAGQVASDLIT